MNGIASQQACVQAGSSPFVAMCYLATRCHQFLLVVLLVTKITLNPNLLHPLKTKMLLPYIRQKKLNK